jgi:hypothetical protein
MEGIRHAANNKLVSGTRGEQVAVLVGLRDLLQRLLPAVGSLVALSTLAVGASLTLEQSLAADSGQSAAATLPSQFVLVFGGFGSLLVAVFYVPAAGALDRRGQSLSAELFPLSEANEASAILNLAENRNKRTSGTARPSRVAEGCGGMHQAGGLRTTKGTTSTPRLVESRLSSRQSAR